MKKTLEQIIREMIADQDRTDDYGIGYKDALIDALDNYKN